MTKRLCRGARSADTLFGPPAHSHPTEERPPKTNSRSVGAGVRRIELGWTHNSRAFFGGLHQPQQSALTHVIQEDVTLRRLLLRRDSGKCKVKPEDTLVAKTSTRAPAFDAAVVARNHTE